MKTLLTRSPSTAAQFIRAGEVAAFPTETVYGLGASVFSEAAVGKIFAAKRRPALNPLIVHIAQLSDLTLLIRHISKAAEKFIEAFFPGPLTVVLPKNSAVPDLVSAGLETVGVRMPRHPTAQAFLRECGVPLAAPSANLSGRPSPTTWQAVREDLDGLISCILKGDRTEVGLESTVVDCTVRAPILLRAGAVTLEQLREVVPATRQLSGRGLTAAAAAQNFAARSPGLGFKHYAPAARVCLVRRPEEAEASQKTAYIGLDAPVVAADRAGRFARMLVCRSVEEYARSLFHFFRQCDQARLEVIYCQAVDDPGLGMALADRLTRAAER